MSADAASSSSCSITVPAQPHGNPFTAFKAPSCSLTLNLARPVQGARKCPSPVTAQTHSTQLRLCAWPAQPPKETVLHTYPWDTLCIPVRPLLPSTAFALKPVLWPLAPCRPDYTPQRQEYAYGSPPHTWPVIKCLHAPWVSS